MSDKVREALRSLVERLEFIHNDPQYQGVWQLAAIHGFPYAGPKYENEFEAAKKALAAPAASPATPLSERDTVTPFEKEYFEKLVPPVPASPFDALKSTPGAFEPPSEERLERLTEEASAGETAGQGWESHRERVGEPLYPGQEFFHEHNNNIKRAELAAAARPAVSAEEVREVVVYIERIFEMYDDGDYPQDWKRAREGLKLLAQRTDVPCPENERSATTAEESGIRSAGNIQPATEDRHE